MTSTRLALLWLKIAPSRPADHVAVFDPAPRVAGGRFVGAAESAHAPGVSRNARDHLGVGFRPLPDVQHAAGLDAGDTKRLRRSVSRARHKRQHDKGAA